MSVDEDFYPAEFITEAQARRLWAIAYAWAREHELSRNDVHDRVIALCKKYGADEPAELTKDGYDMICGEFDE